MGTNVDPVCGDDKSYLEKIAGGGVTPRYLGTYQTLAALKADWPDSMGASMKDSWAMVAGTQYTYTPGVGWVAQKDAKQRVYAGVRAVVIGDSQTACDTSYNISLSQNYHASSWFTFMANASGGKIVLLKNVAIGGQRTDQMLARFATDVLPCDPDVVFIAASINDGNLPGKEVDGIANHIAMPSTFASSTVAPGALMASQSFLSRPRLLGHTH